MLLIINNQTKQYKRSPFTLEELMDLELKGKTKGVAVALNNQVIPRDKWSDTLLTDTDSILIITATQGG
ncbi:MULTISPECIES: sulfur carrier protein ThiS [Sphingobacterium]|uniref:sulfur carrier protein ThiS n=1 Tax=Sphingobacterium TaxID=28453 RepID=UPI00162733FC|nr:MULTISPECIES: sulfur carrier protein ThiS [Sphingobacterium]MBV2228243.1 sulfur carrier protein ThiS [Sphingobacterium mizutaii]